jgi:hypothetical protein
MDEAVGQPAVSFDTFTLGKDPRPECPSSFHEVGLLVDTHHGPLLHSQQRVRLRIRRSNLTRIRQRDLLPIFPVEQAGKLDEAAMTARVALETIDLVAARAPEPALRRASPSGPESRAQRKDLARILR